LTGQVHLMLFRQFGVLSFLQMVHGLYTCLIYFLGVNSPVFRKRHIMKDNYGLINNVPFTNQTRVFRNDSCFGGCYNTWATYFLFCFEDYPWAT